MAIDNKKSAGSVFNLVCKTVIFAAAILLFVALCLSGSSDNVQTFNLLVTIGCGVCLFASLLLLISNIVVLFSKINHRSPEYKSAIAGTVIMAVILVVAIIGFVWALSLLI